MISKQIYVYFIATVLSCAVGVEPPENVKIHAEGASVTITWTIPIDSSISNTFVATADNRKYKYVPVPGSSWTFAGLPSCQKHKFYIESVGSGQRSKRIDLTFILAEKNFTTSINTSIDIRWQTNPQELFYDVQSPSSTALYTVVNGEITNNNMENNARFQINSEKNIETISISAVTAGDAGLYRSISTSSQTIVGCSYLIVKDKPLTPLLSFDKHPFDGFETIFICKSEVRRWPEDLSRSLSFQFMPQIGKQLHENLTINVTRIMKNTKVYCKATDDFGEVSSESNIIKIDPYYGPDNVTMSPQRTAINVTEGRDLGSVTCTAECNPKCSYAWKKESISISQFPDGNVLELFNIAKEQSGTYRCIVKHPNDTIRPFPNGEKRRIELSLFVNVQYPPSISSLELGAPSLQTRNVIIYNQNKTVTARLYIDSNPDPILSLYSNQLNHQRLSPSKNGKYFTASLPRFLCENSGNYTIQASNGIGIGDIRQVELKIQCMPKNIRIDRSEIGTKIGAVENVSVNVIAYPEPRVWWNGSPAERWTVERNGFDFNYILSSTIKIDDDSAFKIYRFTISNTIGTYTANITVKAADKPQPPTNLTYIDITSYSANLSWIAGFDGGKPQSFAVHYKTSHEDVWLQHTKAMQPVRKGTIVYHLLNGLLPDTSYEVVVISTNSFGSSNTSLDFSTKAAPLPPTTAHSNLAAITGGLAAVLVLIILALLAAFIIIRKRNSPKGDDTNNSIVKKDKKRNSERRLIPEDSREAAEYAQVSKPKSSKRIRVDALQESTDSLEYAEVTKPKSSKKINDVEENIYANQGDDQIVEFDNNSRYTTEDGLTYVEVSFTNKAAGRQPVIHGVAERTDYVDIDFTKRAEPLQSDSD